MRNTRDQAMLEAKLAELNARQDSLLICSADEWEETVAAPPVDRSTFGDLLDYSAGSDDFE